MTEFEYNHFDPEIGDFNSRFTIDEIRSIDTNKGSSYGRSISNGIDDGYSRENLLEIYGSGTNPFLYEFLMHYLRRTDGYEELFTAENETDTSKATFKAFSENFLLSNYISETLKHSGFVRSADRENKLRNSASGWAKNYVSTAGELITSFSRKTARMVLLLALIAVWVGGEI